MCRPGIRIWYKFRSPPFADRHDRGGVFLMIAPRVVSFAVAVYLIVVGMFGLNGIYHIIK